jgi:hypothetical protein
VRFEGRKEMPQHCNRPNDDEMDIQDPKDDVPDDSDYSSTEKHNLEPSDDVQELPLVVDNQTISPLALAQSPSPESLLAPLISVPQDTLIQSAPWTVLPMAENAHNKEFSLDSPTTQIG